MMEKGDGSFELIETMRWAGGVRLLGFHLDRLKCSAGVLGFVFDPTAVHKAYIVTAKAMIYSPAIPPMPHRCRLESGFLSEKNKANKASQSRAIHPAGK